MVVTFAFPLETPTSGMAPVVRIPPPLDDVTPLDGTAAGDRLLEQPANVPIARAAATKIERLFRRELFWLMTIDCMLATLLNV